MVNDVHLKSSMHWVFYLQLIMFTEGWTHVHSYHFAGAFPRLSYSTARRQLDTRTRVNSKKRAG